MGAREQSTSDATEAARQQSHAHGFSERVKKNLATFPPAKRQLLRQGSRFAIELVSMSLRGGSGVAEREVIRHAGSVLVLPVLEEAGSEPKVVLIWNWRISVEAWVLELPAGTMKAGEDPAVCAARELAEETGYQATRLEALRSFLVAPGLADERMHLFVAHGLLPCKAEMDADERIVVVPTPVSEVLSLLNTGAIDDAKTMLALELGLRAGVLS